MKSGYSDKSGMMGNIVTIFQQCADKDLVNRLSGVKQCPKTGRLYTRDQWNPQELLRGKGKNYEEEEDRKEQVRLCRFLMFMVCCLCLLCCICSVFFSNSTLIIFPTLFTFHIELNFNYYQCPLFVYRLSKNPKRIFMTSWCGYQKIQREMQCVESTFINLAC